MLIVGMVGCSIGLFVDLLITSSFDYNIWLRLLLIQVLLTALYALKTFLFKYVSMIVISSMVVLITFRGILFGNYQAVTCTLLITIGLVSSLTTKGAARFFFNLLILASLFLILIRTSEAFELLPMLHNAVPYLISYFIVTISSGALKDRYERNQVKLTELVELLNKKNAKIYEQHRRLLNSHDVLSRANENLGELVAEKTTTIEQKNHHLAEIAFANAHQVRGPLARILGLLHLIHVDEGGKDFYITKINAEAIQMDEILRAVGREIEKNITENK